MDDIHRRNLLATLGAVGTAGAFAGCLDESPGGDADGAPSDTHAHVRTGSVVDYPAMVDGAATVSGDERTITYDDPETTFELETAVEGVTSDSALRANRDLSSEAMVGFVAPAYDEAAGTFAYHIFANGAFVEHADWNAVEVPSDGEPTAYDWSGFEHLQGDVRGAVIEPDGPVRAVLVANVPADDLAMNGGAAATGISLTRDSSGDEGSSAPQVLFEFEYDAETERLTVTHAGGDSVHSERIWFHFEADVQVVESFEDTVSAGDVATLSAPSGATVRVVWEAEGGHPSTVLSRWDGPDS